MENSLGGIRNEWVAYKMSWPAFQRWATTTGDMDADEACKEWEGMRDNPKWPRDKKGRGGSLRLLIHVADKVVGYEDFQEANEIRLTEEPRQQAQDPELVHNMMGALTSGFATPGPPGGTYADFFAQAAAGGETLSRGDIVGPAGAAEEDEMPLISDLLQEEADLSTPTKRQRLQGEDRGEGGEGGDEPIPVIEQPIQKPTANFNKDLKQVSQLQKWEEKCNLLAGSLSSKVGATTFS